MTIRKTLFEGDYCSCGFAVGERDELLSKCNKDKWTFTAKQQVGGQWMEKY